jgi:hypothetical protein
MVGGEYVHQNLSIYKDNRQYIDVGMGFYDLGYG